MSVSDDAKRLEKAFVKEAKADDKQVSGAIKHLKAAEKAETKAHKAVDHAISTGEKTEKKEHKTAQKLNAADHAHNVAVQNAQKAEKEIKMTHEREARLHQETLARKTELEQVQERKASADLQRNNTLDKVLHPKSAEEGNAISPTQPTTESPTSIYHPTNGVA
ncbi:uncharacterized protein STEHIDRAFT_120360 [Stereum hirsutum FP-91666 SS1]|uniref:uncharacterized protein n=1 Tax=Stereum hirsutum (strain FP-91666) TaxID=721885 RepID=UPI000440D648|nr:uncharacterized protein STEHIDRAFT_120360 [Stereum hirsutum FP-91666 SS1]EIM88162.1 hypothetical protein STEHIDRAFT_120360 [Stereum hirsutum FP-91666 SS1]